jgi:hypothetical protein
MSGLVVAIAATFTSSGAGEDDDDEDEEAAVQPARYDCFAPVSDDLMRRIVEYMHHHSKVPPVPITFPIPSNNLASFVADEFDQVSWSSCSDALFGCWCVVQLKKFACLVCNRPWFRSRCTSQHSTI